MFPKEYKILLNTLINVPEGRNERIYAGKSPYQTIDLYKNGANYWLALNKEMQFHTKECHLSHKYMVHVPMMLVPRAKSVLIIGGGDGLAAKAALENPNVSIDNIELDHVLINLTRKHPVMRMISGDSFNNPRVNLRAGDGIDYLLKSKRKWDIIIDDCEIEVTHQPKEFQDKYDDYIDAMVEKLNPGGVACKMQPFEIFDDANVPEHYRHRLRKLLNSPNPTKEEIQWVHYICGMINKGSMAHMRQELSEYSKDHKIPYVGYRLPIFPEIGPEMYIYLSKDKLPPIPGVKGVREINLG